MSESMSLKKLLKCTISQKKKNSSSVWNNHVPDLPGRINAAAGEHILSPGRPAGRLENLEVLNLLIVMVTKFSGLVGLWQGQQILQVASHVCPAKFTVSFKHW
jgi:hypothetical protein